MTAQRVLEVFPDSTLMERRSPNLYANSLTPRPLVDAAYLVAAPWTSPVPVSEGHMLVDGERF